MRLKKETRSGEGALDMSDAVTGNCGNEGKGGVEGDIYKGVPLLAARSHGKEKAESRLLVVS